MTNAMACCYRLVPMKVKMLTRGFGWLGLTSWLMLGACGGQELPGHYFEVTVSGDKNRCTSEDPAAYSEVFEYRLDVVTASDVTIFLDDVVLATGTLNGCELSYRSSLFTDVRGNDTIRWALSGTGAIALGSNASCDAGGGWEGEETIEVSSSTADDVAAGCSYVLDVSGTYLYEVE
jgi:hypothetical protein